MMRISFNKVLVAVVFSLISVASLRSHHEIWNTIAPFTSRDFVGDQTVIHQISDLAEFSVRLLQWTGTDRDAALMQGRIKRQVGTYYQRWAGLKDEAPTLEQILKFTRENYSALQCPQLIKLEVGNGMTQLLKSPKPVELMGLGSTSIPIMMQNSGSESVKIELRSASKDVEIEPMTVRLNAGESAGRFLIVSAGGYQADSIRFSVMENTEISVPARVRKMSRLKVRVLDEKGQETPARIYLTGSDARRHTPLEALPRITNADYGQPYGGEYYFYTEGRFNLNLPSGETLLEVVKGLEYAPLEKRFQMPESGEKEVVIQLKRPYNMGAKGWFSGDIHIHANLFGDVLMRLEDVMRITKAEDLNIPHLLACNDTDGPITDLKYFKGKPDPLSEENYIIYVNQEMRNLRVYGHMAFLNLKEFVYPSYTGWPRTEQPYDYPPNYELAVAAKKQGAAVTYVHPGATQEYPVDIALGVAETIDVMCQGDEEANTADWYRLLNCGFRCGISAGTDCFLNVPYHLLAGAGRVYVQTGPKLTYQGWIDAYREGKSFASNAPLLEFSVDGKEAGEEIRWSSGSRKVRVEARAVSHVPMKSLEVVVNGQPVFTQKASVDGKTAQLSEEVELTDSSWVAVRVRGDAHRMVPNDKTLYAHTSPVYCYRADRPIHFREDAQYFIEKIDVLLGKVERNGLFKDAAQKQKVVDLFHKGQDVYRKIVREATR